MKNRVSIVVPLYTSVLSDNEKKSLKQCKKIFKNYPIIAVVPKDFDENTFSEKDVFTSFVKISKKHFTSVYSYSRLLHKPSFYKLFLDSEYILLYQTDCYVFSNELEEWCNKNYDYIGAPWINAKWLKDIASKLPWFASLLPEVGNGGFSLRKVRKFYTWSILLAPISFFWKDNWHEDFFWGLFGTSFIPGFKVPKKDIAMQFSIETEPTACYHELGDKLPFGCHAWEKFEPEFWEAHIA